MRSGDPHSTNLFARLSRYTPSEGELRKREPTEDFCTEALAYLLVTDESFRHRFVSDILCVPERADELFLVETQYTEDYDGRADLVLKSMGAGKPLGIEVKLWADFQNGQPEAMKRTFQESAFLLAPEFYLQAHREEIGASGLRKCTWESVHKLLTEFGNLTTEISSLHRQFADFLDSKGFSHISMNIIPDSITCLPVCAQLLTEWHDFLKKSRDHFGLPKARKWQVEPIWEFTRGSYFFGLYADGNFGDDAWLGFEIKPDGKSYCYVSDTFENHNRSRPAEEENGLNPVGERLYVEKRAEYPNAGSDISAELRGIFQDLRRQVIKAGQNW